MLLKGGKLKKMVNPKELLKPTCYSQAVRAGKFLFISGQISQDAEGKFIHKGDFEKQVRQVFENIQSVLKAEKGSLEDVVKITEYVTKNAADEKILNKYIEVHAEFFKKHLPASTFVQVKSLISKDLLIEIDAVAVLK